MSKLDDKVGIYAEALRSKCGVEPDMDLLRKVAKGLGPVIYNADSETVAASDNEEIARIKRNFLVKKLALAESAGLDPAIERAIDTYGRSNRNKYRAAIYYLLVKEFGKERVYA